MKNGLFLSIDGIDGCGKSTQIELLTHWLQQELGQEVTLVRDPGGTKLGESLREILLHREEIPLDMTAEMLLYMASRAQLVAEIIGPALAAGKTVLSDRFLLANVVYQGSAGGLDPKSIWAIGDIATGGRAPDQTFVLDVDANTAKQRMSGKPDRLESRGLDYMTRVREGFLDQAKRLGESVSVIDANQTVEKVHDEITTVIRGMN